MECRDRRKNSPSGNEGHSCSKCGWVFPNPHPSARHRRAHKKVCGTIQVNDSKTLINGSETTEKMEEMAVSGSRSISGFGSRSNCSNTSEDDVFSDAVTDFPDNSLGVSESNEVQDSVVCTDADLHSSLNDCDSIAQNISDELKHDNKGAELNICDRIEMNLLGEVNVDGYDGRSMEVKLSECILGLHEFEDINKVEEVERIDGISFSTVEDEVNAHYHTMCVHKALDSVDDSLTENVNCNVAQLEKTETINVEELATDGHEVNGDEYDARSMVEKLFEPTPSIPEFDDGMDNKMEIERDNDHVHMKLLQNSEATHELMVAGESISSVVGNSTSGVEDEVKTLYHKASDFVDDNVTEKVNGNDAQLEMIEALNVEEQENAGDGEDKTHGRTICVWKDSDSVDDNSEEEVNSKSAQLEKTEASNVEELESASTVVTNAFSSVHDEVNTHDRTIRVHTASDFVDGVLTEEVNGNGSQLEKPETSNAEELEKDGEEVPGDECFGEVDIGLISDNDDTSDLTQKAAYTFDEDHCIKEKHWTVSASTDLQADSFSQTDSLECNWGSISDVHTTTETRSHPSQESSHKPEPNSEKSVEKKEEKADQDWSTGKQHMPLKSYLKELSHGEKDKYPQKETINTVMSSKEWDSPARLPSKIKTQKGKLRRPYWAPFICCSSVQTS